MCEGCDVCLETGKKIGMKEILDFCEREAVDAYAKPPQYRLTKAIPLELLVNKYGRSIDILIKWDAEGAENE